MPFSIMDSFQHPEEWSKNWPDWHIVETEKEPPQWVSFSSVNATWYSIGPKGHVIPHRRHRDLELGFSTEVITGWRAWQITDYGRRGGTTEKRLQALGVNPTWTPYEPNVATCTTDGTHEAPWPGCMCGFWAFHTREHVEKALFKGYGGEKGKVIGQVAMWGRVLECENGYRGEFAYPQTLQFVEVERSLAKEVATNYGVPYSIVERSRTQKCEGYVLNTEYDFDRLYATIKYDCGLLVRVEISRNFEGKMSKLDKTPPCPDHHCD